MDTPNTRSLYLLEGLSKALSLLTMEMADQELVFDSVAASTTNQPPMMDSITQQ